MNPGDINFKLMADIADLQAKMRAAENSVGGAMSGIQKHVDTVKTALAGLGVGLSVGAFAGMIRGSIDAMDSLNDLSKTTGIAVGDLAGLKLAAKQSGGDLESIATSVSKLSIAMAKDPDKFAKLGVDAKKPLEAFKQFSDITSVMTDVQLRNALAQDVLGKSYAGSIPLLSEGGQKIGEMVDKGKALAGVTQDMADRADEFNDMMAELETATSGAKMKLAGEMLPAMIDITKAITTAYEESGKLESIWVALGAMGAFVFTDEFSSATVKIKNLRVELEFFEERKKNTGLIDSLLFGYGSTNDITGKVEGIKGQIKALQDLQSKPALDAAAKAAKVRADAAKAKEAQEAEAKAREHLRLNEEAQKKAASEAAAALKAQDSFVKGLQKEHDTLILGTKQSKLHEAATLGITGKKLELVKILLKEIDAYTALSKSRLAENQEYLDTQKEINDAFVSDSKAREQGRQAVNDYAQAIDDQNALTQLELGLFGQTIEARNVALGQYRVELDLKKQIEAINSNAGYDEAQRVVERARASSAAAIAANNVAVQAHLQAQNDMWASVDSTAHDVFVDVANGGMDAFERIGKTLKSAVLDMLYQMTIRKWIFQIAGSTTGGSVAGAGMDAMSGVSAASSASSLYSTGSAVGGMASSAYAGYTAAAYEATMGAAFVGPSVAGAGGAMGAGSSLYGAMAGMGPVGWIALAAIAIAALAPTGDGHSQVSWAGSGYGITGANNTNDASSIAIATSINDQYGSLADSLGLKNDELVSGTFASFHTGLQSLIQVAGSVNGQQVYSAVDDKGGALLARDQADASVFNAEFGSEVSMLLIKAMGAQTDLPETIKKIIEGATIKTSTAVLAMVNTVVGGVENLRTALDHLPFAELGTLSFDAASGLIELSGGLDALKTNLGSYLDNFYSVEEKRVQTAKNIAEVLNAAGGAITGDQVGSTSREQFRALAQAQDQETESGRKMYAALLSVNAAFASITPEAKDAAAAIADAAAALKTLLDAATSNADAAYAALERAVAAQRVGLELTRDLASEQVDAIQSVFDTLKTNVQALYGQVASTAAMQTAQGNAFIEQALAAAQSTGYLPDSSALGDAISAARSGADSAIYASQVDADFARLVLAGKLSQLQDISGDQLTEAQRALRLAESQLTALDDILTHAQAQLDAANGINTSVLTVTQALNAFAASITALVAERTAQDLPTSTVAAAQAGLAASSSTLMDNVSSYGAAHGPDAYYFTKGVNDLASTLAMGDMLGELMGKTAAQAILDTTGHTVAYWTEANRQFDAGLAPTTSSIKGFAAGGDHAGGLRIVGERGIELEATGPSRIWNADQTRSMLQSGGSDNSEFVAEMRLLRESNEAMRRELEKIARSTGSTDSTLRNVTQNGTSLNATLV